MRSDVIRQWVNIISVIAVIIVNALANIIPFNGQTTAQVSDRFQVFFTPAGYVFSIWGIIYIGLIAFAVFQALPSQRENPRLRRIGYLFAFSSLANIVWLLLWHYNQIPLTVPVMLILLVLLIVIYLRLEIGGHSTSNQEHWLVQVPFSIYLGWITVATVANISILLSYLNWNGFGIAPEIWTIFVLVVATAIAAAVSFTRGDVAYQLVIIWAFTGIAVRNAGTPLVAVSALILAVVVMILGVAGYLRHRTAFPPPQ